MQGPAGEDARLATLVHDLRTPLAVVAGFAEILVKRGDELSPEQRSDFIARIDASARDMRALLDAAVTGLPEQPR